MSTIYKLMMVRKAHEQALVARQNPEDYGMTEPAETARQGQPWEDKAVEWYMQRHREQELEIQRLHEALVKSQARFKLLRDAFHLIAPYMEVIARWERKNGTLAAIMPMEYDGFMAGLKNAAIYSSARFAESLRNKSEK